MNLLPSQPYVATGATTLTTATGLATLQQLQVSAVGAAVSVSDGASVVVSQPVAVTVSAGALAGSCGQFSLQSGANANARRVLATNTTTATPTTATDGHALSGAGLVIMDITHAGAVTVQVYTYSATSGLWQLDTSLGTSGNIGLSGSGQTRIEADYRGLDRLALVVSVNAGSSAVSGWATGVPVIYS